MHFHFASFEDSSYSRGGVLLQGLLDAGYKVSFERFSRSFRRSVCLAKTLAQCPVSSCHVIVSTPSQLIVIFLFLMKRKDIIFDAGWSLTESFISNNGKLRVWNLSKIYILDFISFHLADKILVESERQILYISKNFLVTPEKMSISFTGFNESRVPSDSGSTPAECIKISQDKRIILFRGKRNVEAGFSVLAAITREKPLENFQFVIISNKELSDLEWGGNVILISRSVTESEMKWCYRSAAASFGQMSDMPRVRNTIPHKTFESMFFNVPIITKANSATFDLLGSEGCISWDAAISLNEFAEKIRKSLCDEKFLSNLKRSNSKIFKNQLSQSAITRQFLAGVESTGI